MVDKNSSPVPDSEVIERLCTVSTATLTMALIQQRVKAGDSVLGLYPPGDDALAAYRAWVAAGEPASG